MSQAISLSSTTNLVYNGSNLGHSIIKLDNVRIWEKYQSYDSFNTWVSAGSNQVVWDETPWHTGGHWWSERGGKIYIQIVSGSEYYKNLWDVGPTQVNSGSNYFLKASGGQSAGFPCCGIYYAYWGVAKGSLQWVDTSHWETTYAWTDHYYY